MRPAVKIACASAAAVTMGAIFVFGRYSVSAHTEVKLIEHVREKLIWSERVETVEVTRVVTRRVIDRVAMADGSSTERIIEVSATDTDSRDSVAVSADVATDRRAESVSSARLPDWHAGILVGADTASLSLVTLPALSYGAHVERRIVGPFWLGAWAIRGDSLSAGASISMEW